ncbi:MAG: FAD-dependent oxidoreductase [Chlorobiaceae bacterium]|nr:FAD-dependent oxidoreductase [Chlorobiaceae bacterium]
MDFRALHGVVIGAGIGGLSAAAMLARRGMHVTVLEAGAHPGGCAGTFRSAGYLFDAGATVGCGFHKEGPLELLGRELDIEWPVSPETVAWQYRRRGRRIGLSGAREAITARFPGSVQFWEEQARLAGMLWRFAKDGLPWPPTSPGDLLMLSRKAVAELAGTGLLAKFIGRTAHEWLASHGLDRHPDFVRFIDAQLLISAQASSLEVNALVAAIALDLPASGTWRVHGGIGRIAELLASTVERDGGAVLYGKRVSRIDTIRREVLGVETADGDALAADLVIANLTHEALAGLDGGPSAVDMPGARHQWGAFVLYLGMDSSAFSEAGCDHLQIVAPDGEPGEGNSLFVSASAARDTRRAPAGQRAVTVSTHTRPGPWFEALRNGRDAYLDLKAGYTRRVLDLLCQEMPEAGDAVRCVTAATPVTWARRTGRAGGFVGGYAQTSLFGVPGPSTSFDNLFLVGDSVFPGQSLPGVVTGARRTVELALRRARKIRQ